jgi:hypothetical protein
MVSASLYKQLWERRMIKDIDARTAQLVWEILNAALYDLTKGNKDDGIAAIEEAIRTIEGEAE